MPAQKIPETTRELICQLYKRGWTLQEVGDVFDVTRERIRQLLREWDVAADFGGHHIRAFVRQTEARRIRNECKEQKDSRTEKFFGCSIEKITMIAGPRYAKAPWASLMARVPGAGLAYLRQQRNADARLIEWDLSLTAWWRIWQESGKWELRGRGKGKYVMARLGDSGPYSESNVYIVEFAENIRDYYACAEHKITHRRLTAEGMARMAA